MLLTIVELSLYPPGAIIASPFGRATELRAARPAPSEDPRRIDRRRGVLGDIRISLKIHRSIRGNAAS
jgi:hypothetical protein